MHGTVCVCVFVCVHSRIVFMDLTTSRFFFVSWPQLFCCFFVLFLFCFLHQIQLRISADSINRETVLRFYWTPLELVIQIRLHSVPNRSLIISFIGCSDESAIQKTVIDSLRINLEPMASFSSSSRVRRVRAFICFLVLLSLLLLSLLLLLLFQLWNLVVYGWMIRAGLGWVDELMSWTVYASIWSQDIHWHSFHWFDCFVSISLHWEFYVSILVPLPPCWYFIGRGEIHQSGIGFFHSYFG